MRRFYLSLMWPLVVLAGTLLFAQFKSGNMGTDVSHYRLKIRGYDPKDLLRGRYLLFSVDWNFATLNVEGVDTRYLCLKDDPSSPYPFVKWIPEQLPECEAIATKESVKELNRFYLPEDDAPIVEKIFQQRDHLFEVEVNVTKEHEITPTALLIDGKSWQTAVESKIRKAIRD